MNSVRALVLTVRIFGAAMLLAIQPTSGLASIGNGNGGDYRRPDFDSAWFLGATRKVSACIEADAKFGLSNDQLQSEVLAAIATWKDYLTQKNALDSSPRIAVQYEFKGACDGEEDIKFYFGTSDATVEKAKKAYLNPMGFAERTAYDLNKGWGKGFIWVAGPGQNTPDWHKPLILRMLLVHELGHVFGTAHVEGTIMSASIGAQIMTASKNGDASASLAQIDRERELLLCRDCAVEISGRLGSRAEPSQAANFKLLMGRAPTGKVLARIRTVSDKLELMVSDSTGSMSFNVTYNNDLLSIPGDVEVFARALGDTGARHSYRAPEIRIRTGSLRSLDGQTHAVLVSRNLSVEHGRLGISFVNVAGLKIPLFIADTVMEAL